MENKLELQGWNDTTCLDTSVFQSRGGTPHGSVVVVGPKAEVIEVE